MEVQHPCQIGGGRCALDCYYQGIINIIAQKIYYSNLILEHHGIQAAKCVTNRKLHWRCNMCIRGKQELGRQSVILEQPTLGKVT